MITNTGKNLLAKYLIGQAPSYASHIAIGCGPKPKAIDYIPSSGDLEAISLKKNLDFEMFRVPIVSRGYVTELDSNNQPVSKIVLTAELPTIERYEITEIGIFSSGSNPTAGAYDSKPVYTFARTENWEYHDQTSAVTIPPVTDALGTSEDPEIIAPPGLEVFQTNADNKTLLNETRLLRYESCRYLNNTIFIPGDSSSLSMSGSKMVAGAGSNHIHLTGASLDFNKNAASDELRFAFSIVSKDVLETLQPFRVKVLIEFADSDATASTNYAQFQVNVTNAQKGFSTNRYVVETRSLEQLVKSSSFTWNSVNVVKIWASVEDSAGNPDPKFYVALDALRLENTTTVNPLYGMSGYSVVRSPDLKPIVKVANTANLVEFRFALDVDLGMGNDS
jgi:hypothetical protein